MHFWYYPYIWWLVSVWSPIRFLILELVSVEHCCTLGTAGSTWSEADTGCPRGAPWNEIKQNASYFLACPWVTQRSHSPQSGAAWEGTSSATPDPPPITQPPLELLPGFRLCLWSISRRALLPVGREATVPVEEEKTVLWREEEPWRKEGNVNLGALEAQSEMHEYF